MFEKEEKEKEEKRKLLDFFSLLLRFSFSFLFFNQLLKSRLFEAASVS